MAPRINGMQSPYAPQLILLVFTVIGIGLMHFLVLTSIPQSESALPVLAVSVVLYIAMLITGGVTSGINPIDRTPSQAPDAEADLDSPAVMPAARPHCSICVRPVNGQSKHCKYCDKCVMRLDHHCFYLNTCIGRRNYKWYFATLLGALLFCSFSFGLSLYALVSYYTDPDGFEKKLEERYHHTNGRTSSIIAVVFVFVDAIISLVAIAFVGELVCLHILLTYKKMTTIEYTRHLRNKELEKKPPSIAEPVSSPTASVPPTPTSTTPLRPSAAETKPKLPKWFFRLPFARQTLLASLDTVAAPRMLSPRGSIREKLRFKPRVARNKVGIAADSASQNLLPSSAASSRVDSPVDMSNSIQVEPPPMRVIPRTSIRSEETLGLAGDANYLLINGTPPPPIPSQGGLRPEPEIQLSMPGQADMIHEQAR